MPKQKYYTQFVKKEILPKIEEVRYLEEEQNLNEQLSNLTIQNTTKKVVEKLIWEDEEGNEWYRVFGDWKCANKKKCGKKWSSAYTWISLQNYQDDVPACELDKYQQECKKCKSNINKLLSYKHLEISENKDEVKPHMSELCAKCQTGSKCQESREYQHRFY